ncbi:MAG: tetratricopeptide repeat protein [Flavisolibacter sp.]
MKKAMVYWLSMSLLFGLSLQAQKKMPEKKADVKSMTEKKMTWTSSSEAAKQLALEGSKNHMNVEYEQAYDKFLAAIKLDPNFTIPLVFLATMTNGDTKKMYAKRALESTAGKTEGEKLFATIVDEKATRETNREVWAKLHEMFPDGAMINHYYVVTRATPDETFAAAQEYLKKFPDVAAMNNVVAYYYMNEKKDYDMAKKYFEKYIQLYPNGSNPYDSMGEFYAVTGDTTNAQKYYTLSLEKYPYTNSSITALKKIEDDKKKNTAKKD